MALENISNLDRTRALLPAHLIAYIFEYMPCSSGKECGCDDATVSCLASETACLISGRGVPIVRPTCESQRILASLGTIHVRDALSSVRRRSPKSYRTHPDDEHIMTTAVQCDGSLFQFASPRLRDKRDFVLAAISENYCKCDTRSMCKCFYDITLKHVSSRLRNDKEVVIAALERKSDSIKFVSVRLRDDRDVMLTAVMVAGDSFEFASPRLRDDKVIAMLAVSRDGFQLEYASLYLRDDKDVVMLAVEECGLSFLFASNRLKDDCDVARLAVKIWTHVLRYASPRVRDNKEVVLVAVEAGSGALQFASTRLQRDSDVVLAATERVQR